MPLHGGGTAFRTGWRPAWRGEPGSEFRPPTTGRSWRSSWTPPASIATRSSARSCSSGILSGDGWRYPPPRWTSAAPQAAPAAALPRATRCDGFEQAGVSSWVLDLRGNGGGYLDGMNEIASRFLPPGSPLLVSHTRGGDSVSRAGRGQHLPARPLAVLINAGSASASEILASALQESGRATIVGERSAGVANAANLDALPDGGGLSVTAVQSLSGVDRRPLDGQGVTPDAEIAANPDDVTTGRDSQLERAENLLRAAVAQAGP